MQSYPRLLVLAALALSSASSVALVKATESIVAAPARAGPIRIELKVSPALQKILSRGEVLVIDADYFGGPAPGVVLPKDLEAFPWITLAQRRISADASGMFTLPETLLDAAKSKLVDAKDIGVNINLYTGRRLSKDNVAKCDFYQGDLSEAVKLPISIACDTL